MRIEDMEYDAEQMFHWTCHNAIQWCRDVVIYNLRIETSKSTVKFLPRGVELKLKRNNELRWCIDHDAAETNDFLERHMI